MEAKMNIEAGQLRRWREGEKRSGTFMVIEERDPWHSVLLLMDGTLRKFSNFTIFQQSEVISG